MQDEDYARPAGGDAGYCKVCKQVMGDGPDACLGWIPGVTSACCGHDTIEPYATLGTVDGDYVVLKGEAALTFFRLVREARNG